MVSREGSIPNPDGVAEGVGEVGPVVEVVDVGAEAVVHHVREVPGDGFGGGAGASLALHVGLYEAHDRERHVADCV